MYFFKYLSAAIFICCASTTYSQNRNFNWCFGDSAGMNFSTGSPSLFKTHVKSRGSSVSISDTTGQLLFYAYTRATLPGNTTLVFNSSNSLMQNGNNIVGRAWYQELVTIPDPGNINLYYIFSVGVTSIYGFYYSVVDMTLDSGRGALTQKNVQLQSYIADDCILAIKHGNGRDWWVLSRRWDYVSDEFYEYLITPSGITGPFIHNVGTSTDNGFYRMHLNNSGDKMICIDYRSLVEEFSFDRCTGVITFDRTIHPEITAPFDAMWSCALSPNERYLYISTSGDTSYLLQLDLQDSLTWDHQDTLWTFSNFSAAGGGLKLAPDDKIYFACAWNDGINFNYPYPDSVSNIYNNNLSVINYPDSPGVACGFQPFSFNLGAGRTYWGLPNNPDYELGPDSGSFCDTLTMQIGNLQFAVGKGQLNLFYHPEWKMLFVNAKGINGKDCSLQIFDLNGKEVFASAKQTQPPYFTEDVNTSLFTGGMYLVRLLTEKETLTGKFIKE